MKIAYCLNSIQEIGGISSVTVSKVNALVDKGHEVFVIVTDHEPEKLCNLSNQVHLIDLEIKYYKDDWKSKFHVIKGIIIKRRKHKWILTKVLNEINPDIAISVGQSEKYFLPEIKGSWKTIREFHYDKEYRTRRANNFLQKFIAKLTNFYDYNYKIKKYDHIVVLTEEDKRLNWHNNSKISVISNPISISSTNLSTNTNKRIIAVGRLVKEKNFSSLIKAFRFVVEKHPDWKLEIYGKGELKDSLQEEIIKNKLLENIELMGYHSNITEILKNFSIFVMTSLYEGLPMSMLEAMSIGLPIVSYDCPYGPRNLIIDGETGYLVPLNNENILAQRINELIENSDLRKKLGKNAKIQSEVFKVDKIIERWESLFIHLFNS